MNSIQFKELINKQYSLDHIFLLRIIESGEDINEFIEGNDKLIALYTSLLRKGLISEENKLTLIGQELIKFADSEEEVKIVKIKPDSDDFLRWWKAYPATDSFEYKGKSFLGSRGLKVKKDECRTKFNKILLQGEFSVEDMIRALNYEVELKMKKSIETGQNKLSYMQNSLTYLNQYTFSNFVEISKTKIEEPKVFNGVDI